MERPLVVGIDGSDPSLLAVDWAVDEAVRRGSPLRLVHASMWERHENDTASHGTRRPAKQVTAEHIIATAAERAGRRSPGVRVTADIVSAEAADVLLREGEHASVVVTGVRGRGELAGLLLGSVSLAVAARSLCPVVVVRGDRVALSGQHERVLLGVGVSAAGEEAVRFAFRAAEERHSTVDAVRAWRCPAHEGSDDPALAEAPARYHEEQASVLLDKALADVAADHPGVRVRRATVEGPARKVLVDRSAAADLVVVGALRRPGHFGLQLGRVSHTLLHHAQCPVAVVPHRDQGASSPSRGEPQ
ncbi:universal stress protein [Streptomyces sp. CRN 30]|uniref:universal stress protein n=1 Tax=Streptomyces sp. CRN 30 TaxID=3075613 RepID=UPI002A826EA1|nr:universal stress protein [Streptomyces sp. CRN 30]